MSRGHLLLRGVGHTYPARPRNGRKPRDGRKPWDGRKPLVTGVPALDGIDLEVEPGRTLALIGPSGCGKSTLLALVAGFLPLQAGEVLEDGRPVRAPGPDRVLLTQEQSLFAWKTALDNAAFGLKARGLGRAERRRRARELLAQVGLRGAEERYPGQLSGGMKQRLALARALAVEPAVLLLDEPFGALDGQSRLDLQELLLAVQERQSHTIILVTHEIDEAIYLADTVAVLSPQPGRLVDRFEVGLGRPRAPEARLSSTFEACRERIWKQLRIPAAPTADPTSPSRSSEEENP